MSRQNNPTDDESASNEPASSEPAPGEPENSESVDPASAPIDSLQSPTHEVSKTPTSGQPTSVPPNPVPPKSTLFPRLPSLSRIMSVVMLVIGIFAVGLLFYRVMAGFFIPLFLAALLVVIFRPVHEWLYHKLGQRARIAAACTTTLVLLVVLLPVLLVMSVAASQFTAMIRQVGSNNVTDAIDRLRDKVGLSLPYAEKFRRLDELADSFDASDEPKVTANKITESIVLVRFLQENLDGPVTAKAAADVAEDNLRKFLADLSDVPDELADEPADLLPEIVQESFDEQALRSSASIRAWMHLELGGTLRSQLRLIPTPNASDFANLIRQNREALQPRFVQLTSATGGFAAQFLIGLGILIVSVYFFLIDGPSMIHTLMRLSPLDDQYERQLLLEFDRTSRAVVLASVLSALAQGILALMGYYLAGLDSLVLLFLITSLMALVPFLGAASVWIPCCLWLGVVEQRWGTAIVLAVYGAFVISSIDNVIKVFVLHGRSQLHPLFALLSVLGGVRVFGPIGILVGPMVVVFLQTLLEILNHELDHSKKDTIEHTNALETP